MVVLHIVHCSVSGILFDLFADAVGDVGLLQQGIANVFLIGQDVVDHLIGPALDPAGGWGAIRLKLPLDLGQAAPVQVAAVDAFDHLRLLRYDLRLAVRLPLVAQQILVLEGDVPRLPALLDAPDHVFADGLALRLGKAAEQGDEELAGLGEGIDVFLFEDYPDPVGFQHPHHLQAVYCVPGEPGEGLGQDHIEVAPFAGSDHPFEFLSFFMLVPVIPSSESVKSGQAKISTKFYCLI